MKIAVLVTSGPYRHQSNYSALQFCRAVTASEHELVRVFFSGDGVLTGSRLCTPPQDEENLTAGWQALAASGTELILCIAAALRHGILNDTEAKRYERDADNLASGFIISGLGQLVEAGLECDRVVTFGGH